MNETHNQLLWICKLNQLWINIAKRHFNLDCTREKFCAHRQPVWYLLLVMTVLFLVVPPQQKHSNGITIRRLQTRSVQFWEIASVVALTRVMRNPMGTEFHLIIYIIDYEVKWFMTNPVWLHIKLSKISSFTMWIGSVKRLPKAGSLCW